MRKTSRSVYKRQLRPGLCSCRRGLRLAVRAGISWWIVCNVGCPRLAAMMALRSAFQVNARGSCLWVLSEAVGRLLEGDDRVEHAAFAGGG